MDDWRDDDGRFAGLQLVSLLGVGGYSQVWLGQLPARATSSSVSTPRAVAVKVFARHVYQNAEEVARLRREVALALELEHPRLVRAYGTLLIGGVAPCLVMQLMPNGSLADVLHDQYNEGQQSQGQQGQQSPSPHEREREHTAHPKLTPSIQQRLVREVAEGLSFLHDSSIVHRDIKTANVLLDEGLHATIADFGIATRFGFGMQLTADVGSTRYMAPEVAFQSYDEKADVFSYGMLMWEVLHVRVPFASASAVQALIQIQLNARPPINLPQPLAQFDGVIRRCWHQAPESRCSMREVLRMIDEVNVV